MFGREAQLPVDLAFGVFIRPDLIGLVLKLCGQVEEESENCIREGPVYLRDPRLQEQKDR